NLIFLGVVFYVFVKIQFRLGLDSLLMGRAGEHIEAVREVIADELQQATRPEWNEVLKRFSDAYKVQFYLFRADGSEVAGDAITLPAAVLARLMDRKGSGEMPRHPPLQGGDERRRWEGPPPGVDPRDPPPGRPGPGPPRVGPPPRLM